MASFDSGSIARYGFVMFSGFIFLLILWSGFSSFLLPIFYLD
jgi:hypothetical protein